MARFKKSTDVQTVLFDKTMWSITAAKKWLKDHGYKIPTVDTTKEYHRFRQRPPFQFQKGTFRTKEFGKGKGIKALIAVPKNGAKNTRSNPKEKAKRAWLPALLIDLAIPISVDLESGEQLKFPLSGKYSMAANRAGTEIWILSKQKSKDVKATDDRGEKLYEQFTGFEHDEKAKLVQVSPKSMVRIGRAMNIVYRSDKFSKSGKYSHYVHPFEHYPTVSVDNVNRPSIVALRGGRIKVKKEGITG